MGGGSVLLGVEVAPMGEGRGRLNLSLGIHR